MAQRSSRKRRKERQRAAAEAGPAVPSGDDAAYEEDPIKRGYARGRAKNEEARAKLVPLKQGERPTAVTVGAIVAAVLAIGQAIAFAFGYSAGDDDQIAPAAIGIVLLTITAVGMWKARYWAVLGMQAVLAITLLLASAALIQAANWQAVILVFAIILPSGALFWFLVKAMARIQMPDRPGADR